MRSRGSGMCWTIPCSREFRQVCSRQTARTSLHPVCGVALAEICSAVAIPMFNPARTRQRFAISAGHYFCTLIVPSLIALARVNISADLAQALNSSRSISR
jgi:hypothetical protein